MSRSSRPKVDFNLVGFKRRVIGIDMLCLSVPKIFLGCEPCALSRTIFAEFSERFLMFSLPTKNLVDGPLFLSLLNEAHSLFVFVIVPGGLSCDGYC